MKGFMKKILSAGLALALVFTMCPVLAYADTPQEPQEKTAEADEPKVETTAVETTGRVLPLGTSRRRSDIQRLHFRRVDELKRRASHTGMILDDHLLQLAAVLDGDLEGLHLSH